MYSTLDRVTQELRGTDVYKEATTQQLIVSLIRVVTNRVRAFKYDFEPYFMTSKLTPSRSNINTNFMTLNLMFTPNKNLLEVTAPIQVGSQSGNFGTDFLAYPDDNLFPIHQLRVAKPQSGAIRSWYPCCINPEQFIESIQITGYWGVREYYSQQGFFDSANTTPTMTNITAVLQVQNVGGVDLYGRTPIFSIGNLIRVENELMEVIATNTATNQITVMRGMRGTPAVAHVSGLPILIWECEQDITNMVTRQVGLLYARRGAYQKVTSYPDGLAVSYPSDLLAEVYATIVRYNYL